MENKNLTPKEKDFCRRMAQSGDSTLAAALAGFSDNPQKKSLELLSRAEIVAEINRISELCRHTAKDLSYVGYQRLAFGSIADAVSLLYMEKPTIEELKTMDLFSVSEIKRPKDGTMEIKFFDRLKALEKLSADVQDEGGATPIYDAIIRGAQALSVPQETLKDEA